MIKMLAVAAAIVLTTAMSAGAQDLRIELERAQKVRLLQDTVDRFGRVDAELQRLEKLFLDEKLRAKTIELRKAGLEALQELKEMNRTPYFQPGEAYRLRLLRDFLGYLERVLTEARRTIAPEH